MTTPSTSVSLESLVGSTFLSLAYLIFGAFQLFRDDVVVATRTGAQHLHGLDALVFYAVVLVAVPSNVVRLVAWARDGDGTSKAYQLADQVSKLVCFGYISFMIFRLFW